VCIRVAECVSASQSVYPRRRVCIRVAECVSASQSVYPRLEKIPKRVPTLFLYLSNNPPSIPPLIHIIHMAEGDENVPNRVVYPYIVCGVCMNVVCV